ncbi:UNVERIFIED_CONTAM: Retrovirus-related Pol polyprotein from transposon TNT 1-94 [Sesamum radiatum]|uniref:Retrovirus-related Pol polyprotein from transposon TNT 1-94 n=1 Tax=Sesamum radiatum TaxID=300843 RepID=A0AAW2THG4_SESRA
MIPQVRGLLPYYRSRGFESYRPILQGFHMTIPASQSSQFRDAVFIEDVFPMKTGIPSSVSLDDSLASTSIPEHLEKMTNVGVNPSSTSLTHEELDEPRRSKRARVVKDFGSDFVTYNIEDDPITFKDAMASSEAKQWKEAVKTRLTTIRVLIALASVYSLPIHQMDVKTVFLYGELEEKIYMDQPEGFVAHGNERKLARYTSCPDRTHWSALDRVLRYLKGTVSLAIHYGRFPVVLEGYSNASWIAKNSGSNGCSGYVFTLGGGALSWKSAKQTLITRSTFEVELCRWIRLVPRQNGYLGCSQNFPF